MILKTGHVRNASNTNRSDDLDLDILKMDCPDVFEPRCRTLLMRMAKRNSKIGEIWEMLIWCGYHMFLMGRHTHERKDEPITDVTALISAT